MIYAETIKRLDYDQGKEGAYEEARKKIDAQLKTKRWRVGWEQEDPYADQPRSEDWAPWWWDGDSEASDSFLESMGVQLDKE